LNQAKADDDGGPVVGVPAGAGEDAAVPAGISGPQPVGRTMTAASSAAGSQRTAVFTGP
jgi:hypothetical protein